MYELLNRLDLATSAFLMLCWGIAVLAVTRLVFRRVVGGLRFTSRLTLIFAFLALALLLAKVVIFGVELFTLDARTFIDRLPVAAILTLAPGVLVALLGLPTLLRAARLGGAKTDPVDPALRAAVAAPGVVAPMQAGFLGGLFDAFANNARPGPYWFGTFAAYLLLLGSLFAVLWALQYVQWRKLLQPGAKVFANPALRIGRALLVVVVIVGGLLGLISFGGGGTKLPERFNMMDLATPDYGGGSGHDMNNMGGMQMVSVADLNGPQDGAPDDRFTLTAQETQITLASGKTVAAWTFNKQSPGPELRVHEGDLVEVTLVNNIPNQGVTLHWHGLNVPNAEDGVAGVTQDAVKTGASYVYRFRVNQVGTFWYHSHQDAVEQIAKGLFGALVVLPKDGSLDDELSIVAASHSWNGYDDTTRSLNLADKLERRQVAPGTKVRLRLLNTENQPRDFYLAGTPFRVVAIDGNNVNAPTDLADTTLHLASGGRYDVEFTMPGTPVMLSAASGRSSDENIPALLFSADGNGAMPTVVKGPDFDPASYGSPTETPFNVGSKFDRNYTLYLGFRLGFYDGEFTGVYIINDAAFPQTPMQVVHEGDLVKMTFINRSPEDHPMHPHGHTMLVLSRNGKPTSGSPWWSDTLNVAPGEIYEVAFKADNPGVWMDHCHNLTHASSGMMMHLSYDTVTSPFEVGKATGNSPE